MIPSCGYRFNFWATTQSLRGKHPHGGFGSATLKDSFPWCTCRVKIVFGRSGQGEKKHGEDQANILRLYTHSRTVSKIALCYLFYEADEDFPASATCLYSTYAEQFLPVDALADVGEYTSRTILNIATQGVAGPNTHDGTSL